MGGIGTTALQRHLENGNGSDAFGHIKISHCNEIDFHRYFVSDEQFVYDDGFALIVAKWSKGLQVQMHSSIIDELNHISYLFQI